MKFQRMQISPAIAQEMLKNNTMNRVVKPNVVLTYAKAMMDGNWYDDSPEMIALTDGGTIVDGQHRLMAVIKAGKTVNMWVAKGVSTDAMPFLDQGAKRSVADIFGIKGIPNERNVTAIIKSYLRICSNKTVANAANSDDKVYSKLILDIYEKYPDYWNQITTESMEFRKLFMKHVHISMLGGYYAAFCDRNSKQAKEFMEKLCTGVGITNAKDPVSALRNHFIKQRTAHMKTTSEYNNAVFIKAWNAFREKKLVPYLTFRNGDPLPKIQ
jgi:hypothetical protein